MDNRQRMPQIGTSVGPFFEFYVVDAGTLAIDMHRRVVFVSYHGSRVCCVISRWYGESVTAT